jgi:hypothetical protein
MAGSKKGFLPDVSARPVTAVRKKRRKMRRPRKASRFFLKSRQNSRHLDSLGASGFSTGSLRIVSLSV